MSRWSQFSLGRLFACVALLCFAALVLSAGDAEARAGKCGTPRVMGFMEAWVISGTAFGLLAKNQVAGMFLGILAGIVSLAAFMALVLR